MLPSGGEGEEDGTSSCASCLPVVVGPAPCVSCDSTHPVDRLIRDVSTTAMSLCWDKDETNLCSQDTMMHSIPSAFLKYPM